VSEGSLAIFVERPVSATLTGVVVLLVVWPLVRRFRQARRATCAASRQPEEKLT
jgi:TctA family transporter